MRVIILVPGLPVNLDQIKGGVHSAVANLLRGFATLDEVQIKVISFSREVHEKTEKSYADNINIAYLNEGPFKYHSLNYFFSCPGKLRKKIRKFKPDIIHYEEGNTFLFTRLWGLYGTKHLLTIHGMSFDEAKRKKKWIDKLTWYFNGLVQKFMKTENIIHLSNFSKNRLAHKKLRHQTIIPNAIIPAYFDIPLKSGTDNTLLYVGLIDNNKNLIFTLQALKKLIDKGKPYKLEILGGYSNEMYKDQILSFVKENELAEYVKFNGWVSQSTVMRYVSKADILVVSSKHESLPMVIAESMAAGKVVVASAVGGIPEMITDRENGFLFHLNEPEQLVNILNDLHNNHEKITTISEKAKATAINRYQCQNVAKKTLEFYKQCLQ